jgi:arylsulfatase B/arylsulfatase I/J
MCLFKGGVRVPAFVHSPKYLGSSSGSVFRGLFHIADWYPTLVGFVRQAVKEKFTQDETR